MSPTNRALLGLLIAVSASSTCAVTQLSGETHAIHRLRDDRLPDLHDGCLDDWLAVFPEPTLTEVDFGPTAPLESAASSVGLDIDVYLGWSASQNRIYAGIQYSHHACAAGAGGLPCADGVEFMVDGDHSGGR